MARLVHPPSQLLEGEARRRRVVSSDPQAGADSAFAARCAPVLPLWCPAVHADSVSGSRNFQSIPFRIGPAGWRISSFAAQPDV